MAKTVADMMRDNHDQGPAWKTKTSAAINSIGAPCSPYCKHIIDFVEQFTGGIDAPFIDFMDSVAKQFACTATLGETFWKSVTDATFVTKESKMPLVRVALVLANMSSPKVEDGIAR